MAAGQFSDPHHRPNLFLEHRFYLARLKNGQNRVCYGTRADFLAVSLPIDLLIRFTVPKLVYNHLGLVVRSQKRVIWHGIHDSRAHLGVPCTVVGLAVCISSSMCVHKEPKTARTMMHTHIKPPWSTFVSWPSTSCVGYVTDKKRSFGLPFGCVVWPLLGHCEPNNALPVPLKCTSDSRMGGFYCR